MIRIDLACQDKSCAPPPVGTGGSSKRWSGVSAGPEARAPIARFTIPVDEQWLHDEGFDSIESFLGSWFTHPELPGGAQAEVFDVVAETWPVAVQQRGGPTVAHGFTVKGIIYDADFMEVGHFERKVIYDPSTRSLTAQHEELFLDVSMQGKGIADVFNSNAVAMYQRYGVREIKLLAAGRGFGGSNNVGGYAWARQGFRISPESDRQVEVGQMLKTAQAHLQANASHLGRDATSAIQQEIKALQRANLAGEDVQPIHVAALGERQRQWTSTVSSEDEDRDYTTWVGKEAMLDTTWYGHFILDPDAPTVASATSLEHVALRPAYGTSPALEEALKRRYGHEFSHYHVEGDEVLVAALERHLGLACYDAACRPPTSGGTGGSSKVKRKAPDAQEVGKVFNLYGIAGDGTRYRATTDLVQRKVLGQDDKQYVHIRIEGSIQVAGKDVGHFMRSIRHDLTTGETIIEHDKLFLDGEVQGRGIGADFYERTTSQYKALGIQKIKVDTAEVGGYAWARQGFRLDPQERRAVISEMLDRVGDHLYDMNAYPDGRMSPDQIASVTKEMEALRAANAREDIQPIHVAAIGSQAPYPSQDYATGEPRPSWIGKDALIGFKWTGFKDTP